MHPDHPMAAEVLPALYSYHLGIAMNDIASGSPTGIDGFGADCIDRDRPVVQ
jgi:hypothetical protein